MKRKEIGFVVTNEYKEWLTAIKEKIRSSQIKASVKVNRELLGLYWHIGADIVERQKNARWGDGLLKQMSADLKKAFPDMTGFSETNLKTMRLWYRFYADVINGQQVVDEMTSEEIIKLITSIPWGHNQRLIFKCGNVREAIFYAQHTLENNWSRDVLVHQIEGKLYERKGKAITNFKEKLPSPSSDLAIQSLKNPYSFDFLSMRENYDEKDLEDALVSQITQFLLELGTGFSYVGRQIHLQVGEQDFYLDLLFYHIKLHCYVVVELKTKKFEPEFAGKLNFYVTAVNKQLTGEEDNPAIGLLICKDKDNVVAEYSLEEIAQPIGIAEYELEMVLKKEYQKSLPSIEELESEVAKMGDEN
ncbi:PDDEXK nuclease domain-containing protein [Dorea sp. D27]|uniref:PDDEXK nuclease domain-containing protein n=1 Tax=Dorea sp. D27 TaxID=658665 RepID=UPI000673AC1E|nr:PDDEXK nuclease domain-containing protein [Dorea sp. D27]